MLDRKDHKNIKNAFFVSAIIVSLILSWSGFYFLGLNTGLQEPKNIRINNVSDTNPEANVGSVSFNTFWEAWDRLKSTHPDANEIEDIDLLYGAISGLAGTFNDPNTVYFNPGDSQKFNEDINGSFSGIGAEIGMRDDVLTVIAPLKNSPAERAGLRAGDVIAEIDEKDTSDMTVDDAVKYIRGPFGTKVVLKIFREGEPDPIDITITRDTINIPTIETQILEGDILYIQLYNFTSSSPQLFRQALLANSLTNSKGLILDFRNNPGGFLSAAVNISGWFIEKGETVVSEKFGSGSERILTSYGNAALKEFPVVVLVNEGSASASEIVAGALQTQNGTKLIGQTTFGKGTVQELQDLSDGSTLKITVANWLLPDGTQIEKNGIKPDYEVEITEEDFLDGKDPQLEKAIEVLREEINK